MDDNLTGVWEGLYNWPNGRPPTPFTAVIIDTAGSLSGSVHEIAQGGPFDGRELTAMLSGTRSGRQVCFSKSYEPKPVRFKLVTYDGELNPDATEIDGSWTIKGLMSERFLLIRSRRPAERVETEAKIAVPVE